MQLPARPDAAAPDGSDVRELLHLGRGSMAHFELAPGRVSRAMAHRTVDEIWYVLSGRGQMWRRQGQRQETAELVPGTCVSLPVGTHFPFPASHGGPRPGGGGFIGEATPIDYNVVMSKRAAPPVRFDPPVADRLASFVAANPGMSVSSAANRLGGQGLR